MKKTLKYMMLSATVMGFLGCQTSPKPPVKKPTVVTKNTSISNSSKPPVTTAVTNIIRSQDGVQDLRWNIKQIKGKKGLFFNELPYFRLSSSNQRVQAHTGCNPIFGSYQFNLQQKTIHFDVKASHNSCDNALAQEADLLDALAQARYFQMNGASMQLLDQQRQVLINADQR